MKRQDIYLQAPTRAGLLADLGALGYVVDGAIRLPGGCDSILADDLALTSAATDEEGNETTPAITLDGTVVLASCTEDVAAVLRGAGFAASEIVDFRPGFPVFGGGPLVEDAPAAVAAMRAAILAELAKIDAASVRPLRAQTAGTASSEDVDRLAELEARASGLRGELAGLE